MTNPLTTHEQDLAEINVRTAIDQAGNYDSLEDALQAYFTNAADTADEQGLDHEATTDWYCALVRKLCPEAGW